MRAIRYNLRAAKSRLEEIIVSQSAMRAIRYNLAALAMIGVFGNVAIRYACNKI